MKYIRCVSILYIRWGKHHRSMRRPLGLSHLCYNKLDSYNSTKESLLDTWIHFRNRALRHVKVGVSEEEGKPDEEKDRVWSLRCSPVFPTAPDEVIAVKGYSTHRGWAQSQGQRSSAKGGSSGEVHHHQGKKTVDMSIYPHFPSCGPTSFTALTWQIM